MTLLFSKPGLQRLEQIVKPGILCVFDFDGTLSPIVALPQQACLPQEVRNGLVKLGQLAPVAVLTGRSVADVRSRLNFEPDYVIGNHGVEGVPGWEERAIRCEQVCRLWKDSLAEALHDQERFGPGVNIEDKRYSLSVHYRLATRRDAVQVALRELFERLSPLPRVVAGKCVFNLLPEDAADKGQALEYLMDNSGAVSAIYVGDDDTDEDVFRLHRDDLLSVRVEKKAGSAAEYYLHHRLDVVQLLNELILRLKAFESGAESKVKESAAKGTPAEKTEEGGSQLPDQASDRAGKHRGKA
jgi:trehalose 6-phosphate phosphatase